MKNADSSWILTLLSRFIASSVCLMVAGCCSAPNISADKRARLPEADPVLSFQRGDIPSGKIAVGDTLTILFSDIPPTGGLPKPIITKVGMDGSIALPLNVTLQAVGKTPLELERAIRAEYVPKYFVNCTPSVKGEEAIIYVGGEVNGCTRIVVRPGMTVIQAIKAVGGFTMFANKTRIEVRRANGGKTEYVNYSKALKDPKLDLPVFQNDQVIVPRTN